MLGEKCPQCDTELSVVIGDRADCSYGEYLECTECGWNDGAAPYAND
jgi:Zn ribbon nucleic-acid-binding protein